MMFKDALYTEIEILQHLRHDNIIKLEEIYEGENTFYVILEFLQGKSLHDLVHKRKNQGIPMQEV
jgi:serine/threonine protein kinase